MKVLFNLYIFIYQHGGPNTQISMTIFSHFSKLHNVELIISLGISWNSAVIAGFSSEGMSSEELILQNSYLCKMVRPHTG